METQNMKSVEAKILSFVYGDSNSGSDQDFLQYDLSILEILAKHFSIDYPIDILEKFERILKVVLMKYLSGNVSGEDARKIALFQKELGFLLKYKSYAIKASTPLGYSVFLQRLNEGFSFQRHITHKTEVFHILEVQPGAQVFLCDYDDWQKIYNKDTFMDWLSGQPNDQYEQYKFNPMPGDIFVIDKLNVVHTVIGCILEEYATISTDMVDRLYDQNTGKPIPADFNRIYAQDRLRSISNPNQSRLVDTRSPKRETKDIIPLQIPGGYMLPLARTNISASRYIIEPFKASEPEKDDHRAASIYVTGGNGSIILGDEQEAQMSSPPTIPVAKGDVLMIPVGIYRAFVNEGNQALELAEHKIAVDVAFL